MKDWFLRAKHWQLFLGIVGLPFFGYFVLLTIAVSTESYIAMVFGMILLGMISMFFFFGWQWSIGTGLGPKITGIQDFNLSRFKGLLLAVIGSYTLMFVGIFTLLPAAVAMTANSLIMLLILAIYLLAIVGFFHTIYQNAKIIKVLEYQRPAAFGDFVGEFFLLWFYFIGVWILQPKINEFHQQSHIESNDYMDHLVE